MARKGTRRMDLDPALASKIFECRRALRTLWGARYAERIAETRALIREVRAQTRETVLQTVQRILKTLRPDLRQSPAQLAFLAAAVDLLEEGVPAGAA